jgi:YVTN family beta-propeller protein
MTYALKATVSVGSNPIPILYSNGSIWVGNFGSASISRINPVTNTVTATISSIFLTSKPVALAEDQFGNVWVACNDFSGGSVSRIDPATNTITASVATADGLNPIGLGMGAGELWASYNLSAGFYERFDTTTLLSTGSVGSTGYSYNFVDDGTHVWFDTGGSCKKVVPATNAITTITTGIVGGLGFLHYAFGYIWRVTNSGIQRVDPITNALTTITIAANAVQGITDDGTDLIVSDIGGELYVVDPTSFAVKQTLTSTSYYWGTTFGGGSIWANARFSSQCKKFSPLGVGWVRGHAWG